MEKKDIQSCFDNEAELATDERYITKCPYCGSQIFGNKVAIWCANSDLEGGDCNFKLMSG